VQLDPDSVYIIGGIVDRNRHKQLCYNKAVEQASTTCPCYPCCCRRRFNAAAHGCR